MRLALPIVVAGLVIVASLLLTGFTGAGDASTSARIASFRVGEWTGGAYRGEGLRGFDRCAAQISGTGNAAIVYSLDSRYVWTLELSSPTWNFLRGASLPVGLRFGKHGSVTARAVAVSAHVLQLRLSDSLAFFENIRSVWHMAVLAGGLRLSFDLPYADQVLRRLTRCVLQHQGHSRSTRRPNSIRIPGYGSNRVDHQLRAEAFALGAKILGRTIRSKTGAVAAPDLQAVMNVDAAWKLHGFIFTVSALASDLSSDLGNLPRVVINHDAAACRGPLFAGALLENADLPHIARAFTSCTDPTKVVSTYYIGTTRKKGGLYLLSILVNSREFNVAVDHAAKTFAGLVRSTLGAVLSEP